MRLSVIVAAATWAAVDPFAVAIVQPFWLAPDLHRSLSRLRLRISRCSRDGRKGLVERIFMKDLWRRVISANRGVKDKNGVKLTNRPANVGQDLYEGGVFPVGGGDGTFGERQGVLQFVGR